MSKKLHESNFIQLHDRQFWFSPEKYYRNQRIFRNCLRKKEIIPQKIFQLGGTI